MGDMKKVILPYRTRNETLMWGNFANDLQWFSTEKVDYSEILKAEAEATKTAKPRTAQWFQDFLSALLDKRVSLHCIYYNSKRGGYYVLGYKVSIAQ